MGVDGRRLWGRGFRAESIPGTHVVAKFPAQLELSFLVNQLGMVRLFMFSPFLLGYFAPNHHPVSSTRLSARVLSGDDWHVCSWKRNTVPCADPGDSDFPGRHGHLRVSIGVWRPPDLPIITSRPSLTRLARFGPCHGSDFYRRPHHGGSLAHRIRGAGLLAGGTGE